MSIVKMSKFTLFALETQKQALLESLQKFQQVQLIDLSSLKNNKELNFLISDNQNNKIPYFTDKLSKVNFAIDFLSSFTKTKKGLSEFFEPRKELSYDKLKEKVNNCKWYDTYKILKEKDELISSLNNKITNLKSDINNLTSWQNLDVSFNELNNFEFCSSFLGTIPAQFMESLEEKLSHIKTCYVEKISRNKNEINILLISYNQNKYEVEQILKQSNFTKISFNYSGKPSDLIQNFNKKIEELNNEIIEIKQSVKNYCKELDNLKLASDYYNLELEKVKACQNFVKSKKIFIIQGWIPQNLENKLEKMIEQISQKNYYIEFEKPKEDENVPILLKNNSFVEPFESITEMYSLPAYNEIDPTPIMSIFYVLFFGMMLGDAGYGILLMIGTLLILKKFKPEKNIRNFMKLFFYLGVSTTVWGAIFGGYFGDSIQKFFGIKKQLGLLDTSVDIMLIFKISIVFGIVHLYTGLGMKAYMLIRDKKYKDALFDVGFWYAIVTGLILLLIKVQVSLGKVLAILGAVGLFLTQGRSSKSIGGKIGGGVYGLYGVTSYVGDIISYSRLLALGLATGFIASAFNLMVVIIPKPFVYVVGPILFIVGHLFNVGVNSLGAYVHTSRLQYLEFFGKFYTGGGKKFSPFKLDSKYVIVKDK